MTSKQKSTHYLLNFKSVFAKLKNVGGACSAIFCTSDFKLWQKFGHSLTFAEPWSRRNLKCQVCVFEGMKSKHVSESVLFAKMMRAQLLPDSGQRSASHGQGPGRWWGSRAVSSSITFSWCLGSRSRNERFRANLRETVRDCGPQAPARLTALITVFSLPAVHVTISCKAPNKPYHYKPLFSLILVGHQGLQDRKPTTIIISP